jgi:hypothetical protein
MTLKLQSCQLWQLNANGHAYPTGHRNSHEFNLFTKPYPVKVGHTLRRKCNVWEKSWQKHVDSLPSEYITLPLIHRNIPMTSHNFHIRLRETTTLAKNMIRVTLSDTIFILDQIILKTKLSNQYNAKEMDIEVDGPFWTDWPTWNIEARCGTNEVDVQAHENFGTECTMSEQASLSTPWSKEEKEQNKLFN